MKLEVSRDIPMLGVDSLDMLDPSSLIRNQDS